ncbi:MAG: carbamoyltransferase HypF [Armatimonadia bacterium]
MAEAVERRRVTVHGIVQGVGFRPFINRLATRYGLSGSVFNFTGGVTIEIEGPAPDLEAFLHDLRSEPPPVAVIEAVRVEEIAPTGQGDFVIVPSRETEGGPILVSPDLALCTDCARELLDPRDRRFRHPFINCTNCGPRFTLVRKVPYDRPNTSMSRFPMCPSCSAEYVDLSDRRYHAQPVACPQCGPTLHFVTPGALDKPVTGDGAILQAQALLAAGGILAAKGIGGFHLACDARSSAAVRRLRSRKGREEKPLAVMVASREAAEALCELSEDATFLLTSTRAPILLCPKRRPERLAAEVAPDSADYGLLLPYTPLHLLLFTEAPFDALVMTSGNLSDEPLCTGNGEALERLVGIADAFLVHDRDILVGCDDSVVRVSPQGPVLLRRARGYVPLPVRLAREQRCVLALGGQLKNTFCLTSGTNAFLSQHLGDLENARCLEYLERSVAHFWQILQVQPEALACDLHPDYLSTRYARELAETQGLPLLQVQHHHAHVAACAADNHHEGPFLGLACDGTGYGTDGTVWGCELLLCDGPHMERLGHLTRVPLAGGEAAVREPWRAAGAHLWACGMASESRWLRERLGAQVTDEQWEALGALLLHGVNCPLASSAGRLFDAAAAMIARRHRNAYEGQAAMALEALAATSTRPLKPRSAEEWLTGAESRSCLVLSPAPLLAAVIEGLQAGLPEAAVAAQFHEDFAQLLAAAALHICDRTGLEHVALSGGTFQNRLLLTRLCKLLTERGLKPLYHRSVPPNDGGISLGQAVVANALLRV